MFQWWIDTIGKLGPGIVAVLVLFTTRSQNRWQNTIGVRAAQVEDQSFGWRCSNAATRRSIKSEPRFQISGSMAHCVNRRLRLYRRSYGLQSSCSTTTNKRRLKHFSAKSGNGNRWTGRSKGTRPVCERSIRCACSKSSMKLQHSRRRLKPASNRCYSSYEKPPAFDPSLQCKLVRSSHVLGANQGYGGQPPCHVRSAPPVGQAGLPCANVMRAAAAPVR